MNFLLFNPGKPPQDKTLTNKFMIEDKQIIVADTAEELVAQGMLCIKKDTPEDVIVMDDFVHGNNRIYVNRSKATALDLLHVMVTGLVREIRDGESISDNVHKVIDKWKNTIKDENIKLVI